MLARGHGDKRDNRSRAKVQTGAVLLYKGAKVSDIVSGGRWRPQVAGGGSEVQRWRERHVRVSGLGSREPGAGYRVRVRVRA